MNKDLIAYCGVDCSACSDYLNSKCPGCRKTEWCDSDICLPVECCQKKGIRLCGECESFPCTEMSDFYEESESHKEAYGRMLSVNKILRGRK
ncbi:MAG: DUF3795 domain-containing protein [Clostridia bacterium]|nr:DUF3795 domain-containing protein [Clostridia bacterium]